MPEPDPRSGVQPDGSWVPAFPGQRAPLRPGHTVSVRHGIHSSRLAAPAAQAFAAALVEALPQLAAYASAVDDFADLTVRLEKARAWVDEHGELDEVGKPTSAAEWLLRLSARCERLRARLGLDPVAAAQVWRDSAAAASDLAGLAAVGRRAREQAETAARSLSAVGASEALPMAVGDTGSVLAAVSAVAAS